MIRVHPIAVLALSVRQLRQIACYRSCPLGDKSTTGQRYANCSDRVELDRLAASVQRRARCGLWNPPMVGASSGSPARRNVAFNMQAP